MAASKTGFAFTLGLFALFACYFQPIISHPHAGHNAHAPNQHDNAQSIAFCENQFSHFDYSAKLHVRGDKLCSPEENPSLSIRALEIDDYSCSETKPCRNGACCPKATGFCNYGPKACGTGGISPNEVCWSNCDAHAECGRYAAVPGTECPLNVCCSEFGFCGMTEDFCKVSDNDDEGCQSNCDQPGSDASGGNVQQRVIGYYEAWAHDRDCQNMNFKDIPVGALTYAFFSFAYITPGSFLISPMDDLSSDLFSDFTAIKADNAGLKTIVAIGGWTFNDPGATQTVFSNMVSTEANRKTFINNLMAFMRKYAFDGVDFDWEYPGAPDRGGKEDDGENFVKFLKELDNINDQQPERYVVSFTVPTSYWYLRWFDLKAADYVDFVNIMSYDLHGVWDSTNPIGNNIYAHTNLTEIKLAMDLFWRNGVKAHKLNLGLGFYGRSFQLSDPTCYQPGCQFKGGASPGPCSQNSGTLTYREIKNIVTSKKLKPYYDKENAVKYITWNEDQWVSFDDADTFKQKIDFANDLGLGGLLIWAIDQDTDDLEALRGVVGDGNLKLYMKQEQNEELWEGVSVPDCYVSDCGGTCKAGFIELEKQPCGSAKPVTRHSSKADSKLCCPLSGAPSKEDCSWRGEAPSCNGHCHANEVTMELNKWGSGKYCEDGNKAYCCKTDLDNTCYWTGEGKSCNGGDEALTFAGTFLQRLADFSPFLGLTGLLLEDALRVANIELRKLYCCPKADIKKWSNCKWYGEPGSCFDNHCPVSGHSVQLTDNAYGFGEDCGIRLERTRVFCCDPAEGSSPFLPVALENLFEKPPEGHDVDTDFELETDDTWGTGKSKSDDDEPSDSAFQFVVLASPEELQVSLDKRDGSHWELLGCQDTTRSEEQQTIQMLCTDISESSNCHKIGLGHGVPGTILQMPKGCGAGKYAVAVSMAQAKEQVIPSRLRRRLSHRAILYDLTFDYDFSRVPRDLGDTQMRIDFSNQPGYWDTVVAAAASKKKTKRTLDHVQGNHLRWLEEEFREDLHYGGVADLDELHKRWFGSDIIAWLSEMLSPTISREFKHTLHNTYILKIVDSTWHCPLHDGRLLAQAEANVHVETSFGFTLICKLPSKIGDRIDLSKSYLTFSNNGDISAMFRLEAYLDIHYDTGEKLLLTVPFPGAAFDIPGIATIGPQLSLKGRVETGLVLSAVMEVQVDIASWEFEQRLPANDKYKPEETDEVGFGDTGNFNGLQQPQFYAGVTADGHIKAHAIASLEFGVKFREKWNVGNALAAVVADGWVEASAKAAATTNGNCPFTWGLDAGVDLYAKAEAPDLFNWKMSNFPLPGSGKTTIKALGECPALDGGIPTRRDVLDIDGYTYDANETDQLARRDMMRRARIPVEPVFDIPAQKLLCPEASQGGQHDGNNVCSTIKGWEDSQFQNALKMRTLPSEHLHMWDMRTTDYGRTATACGKTYRGGIDFKAPPYESSGSLNTKVTNVRVYGFATTDCNDYTFNGNQPYPPASETEANWATEHILELQLVSQFIDKVHADEGSTLPNYLPGKTGRQNFCQAIQALWVGVPDNQRFAMDGVKRDPVNHVLAVLPGNDNNYLNEFVLLDKGVNTAKERMFSGDATIQNDDTMRTYIGDGDRGVKNLKDLITAMRYLQDSTVAATLVRQKQRIATRFKELDEDELPDMVRTTRTGDKYGTWEPMGLEDKWNTFMRDKGATARTKAVKHIDDNLVELKDHYLDDFRRSQADKQEAAGDPGLKTLIGKIEKLDKEWTAYKPVSWRNPF